tara:strand:+ start:2349 stop:2573 length:225 start_codon:yes stop_codon:yes gene_type:complete
MKYGKTKEEVDTEKMIQCREIVKEIMDFGVNENQKLQIIKLLSCELENVNVMKDIVRIVECSSGEEESNKIILT